MRSTVVGRVDQVRVARTQVPAVGLHHRRDARAHRAQVHRHVRRVGNQLRLRVEDCTGEVEPLLDVYRAGGLLKHDAHLFGDMHEEPVHHLETGRVEQAGRCRGASG